MFLRKCLSGSVVIGGSMSCGSNLMVLWKYVGVVECELCMMSFLW